MTLKLVYRRPWEEGVEPLKTFSLQVTVPLGRLDSIDEPVDDADDLWWVAEGMDDPRLWWNGQD